MDSPLVVMVVVVMLALPDQRRYANMSIVVLS
jgi:hypothetical protein